jgi:hypothetical protein
MAWCLVKHRNSFISLTLFLLLEDMFPSLSAHTVCFLATWIWQFVHSLRCRNEWSWLVIYFAGNVLPGWQFLPRNVHQRQNPFNLIISDLVATFRVALGNEFYEVEILHLMTGAAFCSCPIGNLVLSLNYSVLHLLVLHPSYTLVTQRMDKGCVFAWVTVLCT